MAESRAQAIETMAGAVRDHFGGDAVSVAEEQAALMEGLAAETWHAIAELLASR